jgi:hypothetical protein
MPFSAAKRESPGSGSGFPGCAKLATALQHAHVRRMARNSPLDDPQTAAFAWARYRRLMRFMLLVTVGVVAIAIALLYDGESAASVHYYIAIALGIGFTMLLAGALMGLVFLSSGTGHDDSIDDQIGEKRNRGD